MREDQGNVIEYYPEQMEEVRPIPHLNLPDIEETDCLRPIDGEPYYVFYCNGATVYNRVCPCCGSINVNIHGKLSSRRLVHDVNIGNIKVDILLEAERYQCKDCGATFTRSFDGIVEQKQMTKRLYEQIKVDSFRMSFSEVAALTGYSETTIANINDEYAKELEASRGPIIAPRVLGIDEKHIVHKMRGVFVDIESGQLLEMTENNDRKSVVETIEKMIDYDKNIEIVTMDMSNGYRAYIQDILPYAKIVVDKYHVIQDLGVKVTKTKTAILEAIKNVIEAQTDSTLKKRMEDVRNAAASDAYLFKYSHHRLEKRDFRIALMADVCKTFPEFNHLRLLKEGFERIYDCDNIADAEKLYKAWLPLVPPVGDKQKAQWEKHYHVKADLFEEFRTFRNAMNRWYQEVFNYFMPGLNFTNAASEGTNCLIQRMNQMGNGYSFKRLRARALFWNQVGKRRTYSFVDKTKVKKSLTTKGFMSLSDFSINSWRLPTIEYETAPTVEETIDNVTYTPLSVLTYYRRYRDTEPQ